MAQSTKKIARSRKRVNRSTSNDTPAEPAPSRIQTPEPACCFGPDFAGALGRELERLSLAIGEFARHVEATDDGDAGEGHKVITYATGAIWRMRSELTGNRYETGAWQAVKDPGAIEVGALLATIGRLERDLAVAKGSP